MIKKKKAAKAPIGMIASAGLYNLTHALTAGFRDLIEDAGIDAALADGADVEGPW